MCSDLMLLCCHSANCKNVLKKESATVGIARRHSPQGVWIGGEHTASAEWQLSGSHCEGQQMAGLRPPEGHAQCPEARGMLPVLREKRCERANDGLPVRDPVQLQLARQTANGRIGRKPEVDCPLALIGLAPFGCKGRGLKDGYHWTSPKQWRPIAAMSR